MKQRMVDHVPRLRGRPHFYFLFFFFCRFRDACIPSPQFPRSAIYSLKWCTCANYSLCLGRGTISAKGENYPRQQAPHPLGGYLHLAMYFIESTRLALVCCEEMSKQHGQLELYRRDGLIPRNQYVNVHAFYIVLLCLLVHLVLASMHLNQYR